MKAKFIKFDNLKIKKKIDLIKIDVEGDELNVLKGMEKYIQNFNPIIIFECQKEEIKNGTTKVIKFLKSKGYTKFYSIENFNSNKVNLFDKMLRLINFIFFNRAKYIVKKEILEKKFYSFIIAEY